MNLPETDFFKPILLENMNEVKLMNRTDTKYWFHFNRLAILLKSIKDDYFILKIDEESNLPYTTTYFDTAVNKMFIDHHNGKLNRYKIRRRSYVSSGISFLEVKFKSNKGRTIKKRISSEYGNNVLTKNEMEFLGEKIPFCIDDLKPSLINNFSRLTLVNKNFKERCTIDLNLQFQYSNKKIALENLVIVEIKSEGNPSNSPLAKVLRDNRIKTSGFSKYCVGRTVTNARLKRNAFKNKIRKIEKTINTKYDLFNIN